MKLHLSQATVAKSKKRFRVCCNGRRWGKTTLAVEEIKGQAIYKPSRIAYIAPTYQQARDIAWELLKKELLPVATNINESRLEIKTKTVKGGESVIILRGWESIETLRGQSFDFVVIDEVAMMRNFFMYWQEVIRPTLTDRKGGGLFISTPKGFNHFYDLYNLQQTDNDYESFHFTTYDNPYIPKEEIDKANLELPDDRFSQEYLADFRKRTGLVYPEFNRDIHITDEEPVVRSKTLVGVDFGYTNPAAIYTAYQDNDNNFWIRNEYYKTGKTNIELIEYIKTQRPHGVYADTAEPDRIEEMKRHGFNVKDVSKDIEAGIDRVRELFKQNRIRIHPSCVNLITELETYSYPEKKPDRNEPELPIKENDHAVDAIRYLLFNALSTELSPTIAQQYKPSFTKR